MAGSGRVQADDNFDIDDWYDASRRSRGVSMMPASNPQLVNYQNMHVANPMPPQSRSNQQQQQRHPPQSNGYNVDSYYHGSHNGPPASAQQSAGYYGGYGDNDNNDISYSSGHYEPVHYPGDRGPPRMQQQQQQQQYGRGPAPQAPTYQQIASTHGNYQNGVYPLGVAPPMNNGSRPSTGRSNMSMGHTAPDPGMESRPQTARSDKSTTPLNPNAVVLSNLPKGVKASSETRYSPPPPISTANTSSTLHSRHGNVSSPYSPVAPKYGASPSTEYLSTVKSQQPLLNSSHSHGHSDMTTVDLSNVRSGGGYQPPERPITSSTTRYNASQLARGKSVNDRYEQRKAGGDSGVGECCECCCGGCMRCACCSVCCCLGPIITWILVILVLVGIALALYFNWDKIIGAVKNKGAAAAASVASTAATPSAVPVSTAAPPAAPPAAATNAAAAAAAAAASAAGLPPEAVAAEAAIAAAATPA
ncbi:hypothetical protein DL89DRAFT_134344 [Linderina pennispora]|uniref:Uncharacterized protein n=1 Tax=Linderina pennispora TaxID=61395 RepID=A0A1Y1WAP6_9FUNG|nr:uncharacterized protein DL89DRAFT_134344 [Linderina pennispora]ORX70445.1 hypothetical protein DL89DRAFT_134344 [Linderina pennispora]